MNIVRKIAVLTVVLSTVMGCATSQGLYDPQTGQYTRSVDVDVATPTAVAMNTGGGAILGGVLGGLAGMAVGDPASGAALGAAAGGLMGASSTQKQTIIKPQTQRQYVQSRGREYPQTSESYSVRERYAEPQVIYVEPQQPAVVISEPAISFPQVPYYGSYYPSYGYYPYYGGYNNARAHWELEQRRLYAHRELEQRRLEAHRELEQRRLEAHRNLWN